MAGRPKQFSNASEKQKAYRERKKAAIAEQEALRNAPLPGPADGTIEYWQSIEDETDAIHNRLIWKCPLEDDAYRQWQRDIAVNLDRWWQARGHRYHLQTLKA